MIRTILAYAARKQLLMSLNDPRHGGPRPPHNMNGTPDVPCLSQTAALRCALAPRVRPTRKEA